MKGPLHESDPTFLAMKQLPIFSLATLLFVAPLHAESWPQFRGPDGSATLAEGGGVPSEWSGTKNLRWKTPLPGPGSSSPVFHGDKLFVTCYTGYATDTREPGEPRDLGRQLLCLDRGTGKVLWKRSVGLVNREDDYRGYIMEHGYTSSTPVTDGENVYVLLGICFWRGVPEDVVEEIGEGEKGGCFCFCFESFDHFRRKGCALDGHCQSGLLWQAFHRRKLHRP
jgi:hypothetical protein